MIRLLLVFVVLVSAGAVRADPLTVFAAASLKNAFDTIGETYETETGTSVVISYAGSGTLARQIEQGAPADIYVSAHPDWMTYARERGLVVDASVETIASNRLVVVEPTIDASQAGFYIADLNDWFDRLSADGRVALGQVRAVPAGIYAWEALMSLGIGADLQPRLAETDSVRSALILVALGEAPLGIVYASDALVEPRVEVVATIPSSAHRVIAYEAAQVSASDHHEATEFLRFLSSPTAHDVLLENGLLAHDCLDAPRIDACQG